LKFLEEEKQKLLAEAEKRHAEEERKAKEILDSMSGKAASEIKGKMTEAGISSTVIEKFLPSKAAAAVPGAPGAAPAAGATAAPTAGAKPAVTAGTKTPAKKK